MKCGRAGCRSIDKEVAREFPLPRVKTQWTVEKKLGGWDAAQNRFFKVPPATAAFPNLALLPPNSASLREPRAG